MTKSIFRSFALLIAMLLIAGAFAACTGTGGTTPSATPAGAEPTVEATEQAPTATPAPEPTELIFMLWGDKPAGMDDVLATFEEKTKDTLNTSIEIIWTPMGEFFNKVKLKLSAEEQMDSVFDAPWANMIQYINQGTYQELDKYFLNDSYPGLKKAFGEQYVNNNKFNGKMYGVPFTTGFQATWGFFIRKDLREKYGMAKISNINELEQYFDNVLANEQGMIPLADDGNALRWAYGYTYENEFVRSKSNLFGINFAPSFHATVKMSDDLKQCISIGFGGDKLDKELGIAYDTIEISGRWKDKGYFEKDLLTQQNAAGLFKAGKAASVAHEVSQFSSLESELKKVDPAASLEFFVASDSQRMFLPHAMKTDFKAFNFACIPVSSKNTDAVMKFFDWLFADQANHDLFELGIEGKDWSADGDKLFKYPEGGAKYVFPGYELTWNPTMIRNLSGMDEQVYKILDYQMDVNSYYQTPLAGFTFNTEPVKQELAKIQPIMDQMGQAYASGIYEDTLKKAYELNQKARDLGLETIRAELFKQINAYLATK